MCRLQADQKAGLLSALGWAVKDNLGKDVVFGCLGFLRQFEFRTTYLVRRPRLNRNLSASQPVSFITIFRAASDCWSLHARRMRHMEDA